MVCPYKSKNQEEFKDISINDKFDLNNSDVEQLVTTNGKNTVNNITDIFDVSNKNETLKNALCSKKFFACFSMSLCTSCTVLIKL